jgi:RimJ/RimL family protein N-acetyltransferase
MGIISYPIKLLVKNFLNDEMWVMYSVDESLKFSAKDYERLVLICNQPRLYELIFKEKLANKPYRLENAESFESWAKEGWQQQKYFAFTIKDESNEIVAAIDIKSNNLDEAEIGYWASETKRGIITNAVAELIEIARRAGYKKLFANTRKINQQSQGVLKRSGFVIENEFIRNGHQYYKFGKNLKQ